MHVGKSSLRLAWTARANAYTSLHTCFHSNGHGFLASACANTSTLLVCSSFKQSLLAHILVTQIDAGDIEPAEINQRAESGRARDLVDDLVLRRDVWGAMRRIALMHFDEAVRAGSVDDYGVSHAAEAQPLLALARALQRLLACAHTRPLLTRAHVRRLAAQSIALCAGEAQLFSAEALMAADELQMAAGRGDGLVEGREPPLRAQSVDALAEGSGQQPSRAASGLSRQAIGNVERAAAPRALNSTRTLYARVASPPFAAARAAWREHESVSCWSLQLQRLMNPTLSALMPQDGAQGPNADGSSRLFTQ
eukprot:2077177-Pleurochrysis_carterae.AAC.2